MEKQQTATEWLYDNLKSHFEHDGDLLEGVQYSFEQAKAMEKQQIIDAWIADDNPLQRLKAEQYYNETFKKQ